MMQTIGNVQLWPRLVVTSPRNRMLRRIGMPTRYVVGRAVAICYGGGMLKDGPLGGAI